ncbi:MAG TPA: ATP-binding protein, partial [Leptospiraceae bacterium]|nr:ATP-binding protein [Leptospiraceae bacterium]
MSTLQKGKLSIQTGNILPVIKKWLYSEKEIYMRELVSNAFDAITKLRKVSLHEDIFGADDQDFAIDIHIDREKGILTIEDNGIGMTAEEIQKYISQIAFSGAEEFVKKYEQKDGHGIIGHFGLGFYSAFMVAKRVEIDT